MHWWISLSCSWNCNAVSQFFNSWFAGPWKSGLARLLGSLTCALPVLFLSCPVWCPPAAGRSTQSGVMRCSSISGRNNFWLSCAATLSSQKSPWPPAVWYIDINPWGYMALHSWFAHNSRQDLGIRQQVKFFCRKVCCRTHSSHEDNTDSDPQTNKQLELMSGQSLNFLKILPNHLKIKLNWDLDWDFLQSRYTKWSSARVRY